MTPTQELATTENKTLYAIVDDLQTYAETLQSLEDAMCSATEEERVDLEGDRAICTIRMEAIGKELATKTDAVAAVLRRLDREAGFISDERDRLKLREKACERARDWLKGYVLSVMQQNGMKQLKTAINTLFIRASDAVEITDAAKVPDIYQNAEVKLPLWLWRHAADLLRDEGSAEADNLRVKAEPSLSTIKKAIKSGVEVPGADLKFRDNLVLR